MSSPCNADSSKFSEPLPWIGLYIAGASLLCSLLMGLDTCLGFCRRKLWFPCKFFSLNATSLTLLSIATKLPVDLNTSMPRPQDQLTKLSGTVLICTVMGNFITSLGTMDGSEMMSNTVALGILVVTVIVNIGIQIGTGVIYVFLPEHAVIMLLMLVLFVMLCSTAIMIPTAKKLLEVKYENITEELKEYEAKQLKRFDCKLREYLDKYWMMAHTSSPQYVVGRSATCSASGALCLLGALIVLQAAVRSFIIRSVAFCDGKSDYSWSMTLVFISQAIAIGVGTIAPATRWFKGIKAFRFRSPKGEFKVENYWVQKLVKWQESTLAFHISNRGHRRRFHCLKNGVLNVFIRMQRAVVIGSRLISLTFILPVIWLIWLSRLCCCCNRLREGEVSKLQSSKEHLKRHVLHLEGEEDLVQLIMTNGYEDTEHWIRRGKNNQPSNLIKLLESSTLSKGSQRVEEFGILPTVGPCPNCWALPIVNLTSIAIAIAPLCKEKNIKLLRCGVQDSLKYIRLIEENLDAKGLHKMREAADIIWLGIDTNDCWLDKDLKKLALAKSDDRIPKDEESSNDDTWRILEELAKCGENKVLAHTTGSEKKPLKECGEKKVLAHTTGSEIEGELAECGEKTDLAHTTGSEKEVVWPPEVLAADSMYRLCQTLQLKKLGTADIMFEWLQKTIADIIGACLTNLPKVIYMTCVCSRIETREESVRDAAYLLGETKDMVLKLEISRYPNKDEEYIDSWISSNAEEPRPLPSSSNNNSSSCIAVS